jgi:hypothetical protein
MDHSAGTSGTETDEDFDDLNAHQNRKKKQAGGWQAMGIEFMSIC